MKTIQILVGTIVFVWMTINFAMNAPAWASEGLLIALLWLERGKLIKEYAEPKR